MRRSVKRQWEEKQLREITFRGKSVNNGEWVYGYLIGRANDTGRVRREILLIDNGAPFNKVVEVIPETVGQYIGLVDRNGEKIFEGDILSVEGVPQLYSVEFTTADASFAVRNCKDRRYATNLTVDDQNELCIGAARSTTRRNLHETQ